jgi:hypothetical protein
VTHHFCKLHHGGGCFGFFSSTFNILDEKLQRRFLQYDGEVRGLRLG